MRCRSFPAASGTNFLRAPPQFRLRLGMCHRLSSYPNGSARGLLSLAGCTSLLRTFAGGTTHPFRTKSLEQGTPQL